VSRLRHRDAPIRDDTSEQLDYVPGYFQVIGHVRPKLACRACVRILQAPGGRRCDPLSAAYRPPRCWHE
jgi:transposase